MKFFKHSLLVLAATLLASFHVEARPGWPANYQGVMLQGFYWDSFDDSSWSNLESQADELSQYFSLIWIPNSARAASNPGMGYDPVYWFTNHNTRFGTEAELRSMIKTFKDKGTGIIEDVVINHRSGKSNWTDFPSEMWNGQTWHIGTDGICSTDEVRLQPGQATPTGAPDTGEDFNGSRDLDHTNANVQNNCKNYCKFLLEDMGYAGFRYDMVKGYGGQYTKIYNEYSQPEFSVGEYWDGSYDAVKAWIDATGKTSAAFDFPCKYAINKAFSSNDMTQLVWKANGTTDQPAGMIHFGYPQYAVTFVDNHDTCRDDYNKFNGNVVAANAFILFSPGTPCVFLPHWQAHKAELKKLISLRNAVGIHNMSDVKVLKCASNCYMAEVTGTNGKAVVKIGSAMDSPSGYTNDDIKASGTDYCVWSKVNGGGDDPQPSGDVKIYLEGLASAKIYVYKDNSTQMTTWDNSPSMTTDASTGYLVYTLPEAYSTSYVIFRNGNEQYPGANAPGLQVNGKSMKFTWSSKAWEEYTGGDDPQPVVPQTLGVLSTPWGGSTANEVSVTPMTKNGESVWGIENYTVGAVPPAPGQTEPSTDGYVQFAVNLDATTWDELNADDRYGSAVEDIALVFNGLNASETLKCYTNSATLDADKAGACKAFRIAPGIYDFKVIFSVDGKISLECTKHVSGVENVGFSTDDESGAEYYNLLGVKVSTPSNGIYLRRVNGRVSKIIVK